MMFAAKYREANSELLKEERKKDRLFLYLGTFFMIAVGCSMVFLLVMAFLTNLGG
ncbi:hypothetical protein SAMN05444355_107177 [Flavobacterium frigoris]|uniref:Uncharacterized protein n=1 Tax=Flavobacterium frigoris TaxID=229204 RepID=A0A1H9LXV8_FLAFI|nr:hypothetical protein SAMN05444355_107177 [Flavobacterium frigoris]